jgi:NAD+ kinase
VSRESVIRMSVENGGMEPSLTVDGQVYFMLAAGHEVEVRAAEESLRLLKVCSRSFYETLRTKLGWGGHLHYARQE